jgi:hypothetical protein
MFRQKDPTDPIDWPALWADLLQGAGAGLLHYDGSRLAQAALLGLEAFDAAQERREKRNPPESDEVAEHGEEQPDALARPDLSPEERAAYLRSSPEERLAFDEEMAELSRGDEPGQPMRSRPAPAIGRVPTLPRRQPLSVSPFEDWPLNAVLPFGPGGRLDLPTDRR